MNLEQLNKYSIYANEKYMLELHSGKISKISKKAYFRKCAVLTRLIAQYTIEEYNEADFEYNKSRRMRERFDHQGVKITTLDKTTELLNKRCKFVKSVLALLGRLLCTSLDGWQNSGATYNDLYNFCCCSEKTISEMKKDIDEGTTEFSKLVCIHCPDDKNKGDFVDITKYAPITHAVKEYFLEELQNACKNRETKLKVRDKLLEMFPEFNDCILTEHTDEYGDTFYMDSDGSIIC